MTAFRRVDVLVNVNARELGAGRALRRAIDRAALRGRATVHVTTSLDELHGAAQAIAEHRPDAVVLAGGDGSHMSALSALSRTWPDATPLPPVALAPGGTMNTVARNLGMRSASPSSVERLVASVCDGTATPRRTGTLRVSDDRAGLRVGFIFGSALVARFFDLYYRGRPGPAGAAAIAARIFAGSFTGSPVAHFVLDPEPATLHVDGVEQPGRRWSLLLASVVPDLGLHMRATYRGGESLDRFHAVASGLPPQALGLQLPRVLAGRPLVGEPRVDTLARGLRVHFEGPDAAYVLDGDVVHAARVTVSAGPVITVLT